MRVAPPGKRTWAVSRSVLQQGDVRDEEAHEPLAVAGGGAGIPPQAGHVRGQGEELGLLGLVQDAAVGGALALVDRPGVGEVAQPGVPLGLEDVRHQAVVGVDPQEALLGQVGLVVRALHAAAAAAGRPRRRGPAAPAARRASPGGPAASAPPPAGPRARRPGRRRAPAGRPGRCGRRAPAGRRTRGRPGRRGRCGSARSSARRSGRSTARPWSSAGPSRGGPARRSAPKAWALARRRRPLASNSAQET